jgi:formylglycine-generating enzyme
MRRAVFATVGLLLGVACWGPSRTDGETIAAPEPRERSRTVADTPRASVAQDVPGLTGLATASPATSSQIDLLPEPGPRDWQLVAIAKSHGWQIAGSPGEDVEKTDEREKNRGACPSGMIEVEGKMKQNFLLDELQMQTCTQWIDKKWPERCGAYDRDKWIKLSKDLPTQPMHFCIDRFEYPNKKGAWPVIMVNWFEA